MAKGKKSHRDKCKAYLESRKRIKNKTAKLNKRIKNLKPETQKKILESCPIGRKKESKK